jgi:hypothetical protein
MSTNGHRHPPRPRIEFSGGPVDEREAAAVTAAIERFMADTAPPPAPPEDGMSPWQRAALLEGVSAKRRAFPADPGSGLPLG